MSCHTLVNMIVVTFALQAQGEASPQFPLNVKHSHPDSATPRVHVIEADGDSIVVELRDASAKNSLLQLEPATSGKWAANAEKAEISVIYINPTVAPIIYVGSLALMAVGICWMFKDRGAGVCLSIVCNVFALSTMSLLIRNIYVIAKFQFPAFITVTHAFVTALVGISTLAYKNGPSSTFATFPDARTWFRGIIPVGAATGASLGLANMGLWYSNAHFYEMLGSSGFLVTAAVGVVLGVAFEWKLLPPMLALTAGSVILSFGEMHFSIIGAACILSATLFRAVKAQMQGILMSPNSGLMQLGPVETVTCTSLVSLVLMLVWSAIVEGREPWSQVLSTKVFIAVLAAALNASVLNIANLFVIRSLGAVAQQCVGQLKSVLCCVGAVVAFHEAITHQQVLGYSIVITSVFAYNHIDMKLKDAKRNKKDCEVSALNPSSKSKV